MYRSKSFSSRTPAFQRRVIRVLVRLGFPCCVAEQLAGPAWELYLAGAREQGLSAPGSARPIRGRARGIIKGPKKDVTYLRDWAVIWYQVDVLGFSQASLVNAGHSGRYLITDPGAPRGDRHTHLPPHRRADAYQPVLVDDAVCGCAQYVRRAVRQVRSLLGVPAPARS